MEPLTPIESKILSQLKKVKSTGMFYDVLQMAFSKNDTNVLRQLIADIRVQVYDAPDETADIIGMDTFMMIAKM